MKDRGQAMMRQLLEDLTAVQPRPTEWEGVSREDQIALLILSAIEASHGTGVELAEWPGLACDAAAEILRLAS